MGAALLKRSVQGAVPRASDSCSGRGPVLPHTAARPRRAGVPPEGHRLVQSSEQPALLRLGAPNWPNGRLAFVPQAAMACQALSTLLVLVQKWGCFPCPFLLFLPSCWMPQRAAEGGGGGG